LLKTSPKIKTSNIARNNNSSRTFYLIKKYILLIWFIILIHITWELRDSRSYPAVTTSLFFSLFHQKSIQKHTKREIKFLYFLFKFFFYLKCQTIDLLIYRFSIFIFLLKNQYQRLFYDLCFVFVPFRHLYHHRR